MTAKRDNATASTIRLQNTDTNEMEKIVLNDHSSYQPWGQMTDTEDPQTRRYKICTTGGPSKTFIKQMK